MRSSIRTARPWISNSNRRQRAGLSPHSCGNSAGPSPLAASIAGSVKSHPLQGLNPPCRFAADPVFLRGLFRRRAAALAQLRRFAACFFPQFVRLRGRYAASFHTTIAAPTARHCRRCGRDGLSATSVPRTGGAGVVQQHCRPIAGSRLNAVVAPAFAARSDRRIGR